MQEMRQNRKAPENQTTEIILTTPETQEMIPAVEKTPVPEATITEIPETIMEITETMVMETPTMVVPTTAIPMMAMAATETIPE